MPVRLEGAQRIRSQRIAGTHERSRARSATERMIFAGSATPFELAGIVQRPKKRCATIHLDQAIFAYVAGGQREKSGRADIASVRYKHDAMAVPDSEAAKRACALDLLAGHAVLAHALQRHSSIRRRFRGCDD